MFVNCINCPHFSVVAGNQGVPDALQKCHTLSKDLQKNQTYIMNRLSGFTLLLTNFSLEMTEVKSGLQAVQDQLKSSPDLVNIPRLIKDLSASVASFGSQIRDLNSTVSTLKEQNGKLDNVVVTLVSNLTETKMKLIELSNTNFGRGEVTEKMLTAEKEAILARVSQVSGNLSEINGTLNNKLKWTTDDQTKDRVSSLFHFFHSWLISGVLLFFLFSPLLVRCTIKLCPSMSLSHIDL